MAFAVLAHDCRSMFLVVLLALFVLAVYIAAACIQLAILLLR